MALKLKPRGKDKAKVKQQPLLLLANLTRNELGSKRKIARADGDDVTSSSGLRELEGDFSVSDPYAFVDSQSLQLQLPRHPLASGPAGGLKSPPAGGVVREGAASGSPASWSRTSPSGKKQTPLPVHKRSPAEVREERLRQREKEDLERALEESRREMAREDRRRRKQRREEVEELERRQEMAGQARVAKGIKSSSRRIDEVLCAVSAAQAMTGLQSSPEACIPAPEGVPVSTHSSEDLSQSTPPLSQTTTDATTPLSKPTPTLFHRTPTLHLTKLLHSPSSGMSTTPVRSPAAVAMSGKQTAMEVEETAGTCAVIKEVSYLLIDTRCETPPLVEEGGEAKCEEEVEMEEEDRGDSTPGLEAGLEAVEQQRKREGTSSLCKDHPPETVVLHTTTPTKEAGECGKAVGGGGLDEAPQQMETSSTEDQTVEPSDLHLKRQSLLLSLRKGKKRLSDGCQTGLSLASKRTRLSQTPTEHSTSTGSAIAADNGETTAHSAVSANATGLPILSTSLDDTATGLPILSTSLDDTATGLPILSTSLDDTATGLPILSTSLDDTATGLPILSTSLDDTATGLPILSTSLDDTATGLPILSTSLDDTATGLPILSTSLDDTATGLPILSTSLDDTATGLPILSTSLDDTATGLPILSTSLDDTDKLRAKTSRVRQELKPVSNSVQRTPGKTELPQLYAPEGVDPAGYTVTILHRLDNYFLQLRLAQGRVVMRVPWSQPIPAYARQPRNTLDYRFCPQRRRGKGKAVGHHGWPTIDLKTGEVSRRPSGSSSGAGTSAGKQSPSRSSSRRRSVPRCEGEDDSSVSPQQTSGAGTPARFQRSQRRKVLSASVDEQQLFVPDKPNQTAAASQKKKSVSVAAHSTTADTPPITGPETHSAAREPPSVIPVSVASDSSTGGTSSDRPSSSTAVSCVPPSVASQLSPQPQTQTLEPDSVPSSSQVVTAPPRWEERDSEGEGGGLGGGLGEEEDDGEDDGEGEGGREGGEEREIEEAASSNIEASEVIGVRGSRKRQRRAYLLEDSDTDTEAGMDTNSCSPAVPIGISSKNSVSVDVMPSGCRSGKNSTNGNVAAAGRTESGSLVSPFAAALAAGNSGKLLKRCTRTKLSVKAVRARQPQQKRVDVTSDVIDLTEDSQNSLHVTPGPNPHSPTDPSSLPLTSHPSKAKETGGGGRDREEEEKVPCPLCAKSFPQSAIEAHAASCQTTSPVLPSSSSSSSKKRPLLLKPRFNKTPERSPSSDPPEPSTSWHTTRHDTDHTAGHSEEEQEEEELEDGEGASAGPQLIQCEGGGYQVDPTTISSSPIKTFRRITDLEPQEQAGYYNQFSKKASGSRRGGRGRGKGEGEYGSSRRGARGRGHSVRGGGRSRGFGKRKFFRGKGRGKRTG